MDRINLIFFPFAGGNRYSYLQLQKLINAEFNPVAVELPGRGERIHDELLTNMEELSADAFFKLQPMLQQPFVLYGHSMGGLMAYLFAQKAIEIDRPPLHIFVSGKGGPAKEEDDGSYLLPSSQFRQRLHELGGMPEEMLRNDLLMEFLEPIIKADFEAIQTYKHKKSEPLNIPITLMLGTNDYVTLEDGLLWQEETKKKITVYQFNGGHFFIYDHLQAIADVITQTVHG